MLRRSSLIECVSVLPGNRCLQNVEIFLLQQYVQPCLLKNPKYTFYTIKSSLKLAYYIYIYYFLQVSSQKIQLIEQTSRNILYNYQPCKSVIRRIVSQRYIMWFKLSRGDNYRLIHGLFHIALVISTRP
jgi:hypothetical protein